MRAVVAISVIALALFIISECYEWYGFDFTIYTDQRPYRFSVGIRPIPGLRFETDLQIAKPSNLANAVLPTLWGIPPFTLIRFFLISLVLLPCISLALALFRRKKGTAKRMAGLGIVTVLSIFAIYAVYVAIADFMQTIGFEPISIGRYTITHVTLDRFTFGTGFWILLAATACLLASAAAYWFWIEREGYL